MSFQHRAWTACAAARYAFPGGFARWKRRQAGLSSDSAQIHRNTTRLILASASPRRRALLIEQGYEVEVVVPPFKEPTAADRDLPPAHLAQALSHFKAQAVAMSVHTGMILAGDTIVTLGSSVFGKPIDRADAGRILTALSGTTHDVITGVTLLDAATGERAIRHDTTAVTMYGLSADEIDAYLDSDAWIGKAGAFGIQDRDDPFVERIDGSYTNVVGFPMELIDRMLRDWGIVP